MRFLAKLSLARTTQAGWDLGPGTDRIWARERITFRPRAESHLGLEPNTILLGGKNSNMSTIHLNIRVLWAWPIELLLPAEFGPKWWRHPPFWAITPEEINQFRCGFRHLIGIDILYPYAEYKKILRTVFRKSNKGSILGQNMTSSTPKKGINASIEMGLSPLTRHWCPLSSNAKLKKCWGRNWRNYGLGLGYSTRTSDITLWNSESKSGENVPSKFVSWY